MAPQAEFLVAGGDSHASVRVALASFSDFTLALSPFSTFSALSSLPLAHPLSFPASPPAPAPAGYGRPRHL